MTSDRTSEMHPPQVISLRDAAVRRLVDVERIGIPGLPRDVDIALPVSYAKAKKKRFPLLLLLDTGACLGSAIEMSRLMAQTREVRETILVALAVSADDCANPARLARSVEALLAACAQRYRTEPQSTTVFGYGAAASCMLEWLYSGNTTLRAFIAADPSTLPVTAISAAAAMPQRQLVLCAGPEGVAGKTLQSAAELIARRCAPLSVSTRSFDDADRLAPSLTHGLRMLLSTGLQYGDEVVPMRKPLTMKLMCLAAPLLGRLTATPPLAVVDDRRYRMRSDLLDRDFEVFVVMPASAHRTPGRRYPALVVLDASIELSVVAETAARMAARGELEELIVIGIGTPRAEGATEFGFRRFEELSVPIEGYDFGDDLGRIFRSLFAMRGQDARRRLGRAPDFLGFIAQEMLPVLQRTLPIDIGNLGLLGHSAGGTFVAYALGQAASPFRHYIGISPGIGIGGDWLMRQARLAAATQDRRVVLTVGSAEKTNAFNVIAGIHQTEAYAQRLLEEGGIAVVCRCFDGETHSSIFPHSVALGLSSVYGHHRCVPAANGTQAAAAENG